MKLIKTCLAGLFLSVALTTRAEVYVVQHNFTTAPDGAYPQQVVAANGVLYGSTTSGGANSLGSLFSFSTNGSVFSTFYSFTSGASGGSSPNNVLVTNNVIYGTTISGGTNSSGMIFAVGTNGAGFTSLYCFAGLPDGSTPQAGLILLGSTLYGTTYGGGTANFGSVFKINTNGTGYAVIHSFTNSPDGYGAQGSELVSDGSLLYGTTTSGGTNGVGVVYALNTNGGGYTILHTFTTNSTDGVTPAGQLLLNSGILYGGTVYGGTNGLGMIFAINTNGTGYRNLYSFDNSAADGGRIWAKLNFSGGYLFGTASAAGASNGGTLFMVGTNGSGFTVLHNFSTASGYVPKTGVVRLGNALWGSTLGGGSGGGGVFYSLGLPVITSQPQGVTVSYGGTASFSVTAVDDSAFTYQWYFNNTTLLAGQTNSTLTLSPATNAGPYTVVVADAYGAVTSTPAALTLNGTAPTITQQPQNFTVTNGLIATFTNAATGSAPLSYQWYFNTNTPVGGGTSAILTLNPATTNNAGYYLVIVTNLFGSATSSPAKLTVVLPPSAPTITQQPQNYSVTNGFTATFTNVASGNGPFYYQWYFNTNTGVTGGTNAILAIGFATTNLAGFYTVVVSNNVGSVTSSPARLTVISTKPLIITQPADLIVTNGNVASFAVLAAGQSILAYQWYSNSVNTAIGTRLVNQTSSTYSFTSTTNANGRFYSVVVTNILGAVTSTPAMLTVVSKPLIVTNPQPITVSLGYPATFTVTALGLNLRYQWYSNTVATAIGTRLTGETNVTYSFTSITNANNRYYSVVVTNTSGATTSTPALLVVSSVPLITLQPIGLTITNGASVTFTSTASGPGTLAYQWLFATNVFIPGATNTILALTNANQPGAYAMKVTNSFGAVTSSPAQLNVVGQPTMLSAQFNPASGSYSFSFINLAGSTNRLWASSNLLSPWRAIATNVMATNALWFFTDPTSAKTNAARFYRFSTP